MRAICVVLAFVLTTTLSGCIDIYLDLIPHDDGSYTIRQSWVFPVTMLDELAAREDGEHTHDTARIDRRKMLDSLRHDDSLIPQNWKYLARSRHIITSDTIIDTQAWVTNAVTTSTVDSVKRYWWGALSHNQARIDSVGPTGVEIVKNRKGTTVTFAINPDRGQRDRHPKKPTAPDKDFIGHQFHFRLLSPNIVQSSIKPPCLIIPDGAEWPVRFTEIDTLEALCKLPQKASFMIRPPAKKR
ncbi:MAG: hypothetical protein JSS75_10385 [Bacteroidetes bacterium]|nr:hypothetical protein [Bacteroidota bacterium]